MTWRRFGLGLMDAAINSAASSGVVIFVDPDDFNFGSGLPKLLSVFCAGAILGALMWLKNHRLPGVDDDGGGPETGVGAGQRHPQPDEPVQLA